jgi:UDP:flavonoid glycosyltransferase YjiC (YdhE family)
MKSAELSAARAEALFISMLQPSDDPTPMQVRAAVAAGLRRNGMRGCAGRVAHEFGAHPIEAVARMSWVLAQLRSACGPTSQASIVSPEP